QAHRSEEAARRPRHRDPPRRPAGPECPARTAGGGDRQAGGEAARGVVEMTKTATDRITYAVQRSRRSTADIVVERDGSVIVRAPDWADDATISDIVEAKYYWISRALAEWRELNATR